MRMTRLLPNALRTYGAVQLFLGAWMVAAPGSFFTQVGPFGTRNDHYLRDVASWSLALGALAFLAASRPAWRLPVLALAALQSALHAVNHLIDVGQADPSWIGVADAVSLGLLTVLLVVLVRREVPA